MGKETVWDMRRAAKLARLKSIVDYWDVVADIMENGIEDDEQPLDLQKVLSGDSADLYNRLERLIKAYYVNILEKLECGLVENKELYKLLRSDILGGGNDILRAFKELSDDYHILKLVETKKVVYRPEERTNGKA